MIRTIAFTAQGQLHRRDYDLAGIAATLEDNHLFQWIDLDSSTAEEAKKVLEEIFHFHPLSIEDCLAADSAPKLEQYVPREGDRFAPHLFIVMRAVDYNRSDRAFASAELNFFLGGKFLVTTHPVALRTTTEVLDLLTRGAPRPPRGPDRIAHLLLDSLVDHYEPALDELSSEIAAVEERALQQPTPSTLNQILGLKKRVQLLRAIMGPQREILARFSRGELNEIRPHLLPYFRDVYDDIAHIAELAQSYADSLTGILQVYLNMSSNQTGEIVKLLTLITVITTPLMMIGTWYGMNFRDMPELSWRHGYAVAAAVMLTSTAATYLYFKKKKWF